MIGAGRFVAGLGVLDLLLIFQLAFGLTLVPLSLVRRGDQLTRVLMGALGVATVVVAFVLSPVTPSDVFSRLRPSRFGWIVAAGTVLLAVGLVDLIFGPLSRLVVRVLGARTNQPPDGTRVIAALCLFVVASAALVVLSRHPSLSTTGGTAPAGGRTGRAETVATFDLPGAPTGVVFRDDTAGYISLGSGQILEFRLPRNSRRLTWNRVASGLGQLRGVAILDGQLFVTEITSWPCPSPPAQRSGLAFCTRSTLDELEDNEAELEILGKSRGRVSAFSIDNDGSLGRRRTVFDDLPVVSSVHAPNGIAAGSDGHVYASIGNVDGLWDDPDAVDTLGRPNLDLLGTIIRFDPDDSEPEVFASGIRNLYGLTFDDDGRLYGTDNDGPTNAGYRAEEVLHIERGVDYGYPDEGTTSRLGDRTRGPLWILDAVGSAGIEWAPRIGLPPGLIIGSLERLSYIGLETSDEGVTVATKPVPLETSSEFRAVVESAGDGRLLVGGPGPLRLVELR